MLWNNYKAIVSLLFVFPYISETTLWIHCLLSIIKIVVFSDCVILHHVGILNLHSWKFWFLALVLFIKIVCKLPSVFHTISTKKLELQSDRVWIFLRLNIVYQNSPTSFDFTCLLLRKLLIYREKCKSICIFGSEVKKMVMFVLANRC